MSAGRAGLVALSLVVAGAGLLMGTRQEVVTVSGNLGEVSVKGGTGYLLGVLLILYGVCRAIAPSGHTP